MRVGPATNVARINVSETITALWTFAHANGISLDDIIERTFNAGVMIDGVKLHNITVLQRGFTNPTDGAHAFDVVGDNIDRLLTRADGMHMWSDGANPTDTNLYRSAADVLKTDVALHIGGALTPLGDFIMASRDFTLGNASFDDVATGTVPVQRITSNVAGSIITGFAGGVAGRVLIITHPGLGILTLKHNDGASVVGNRLRMPNNADQALTQDESVSFWYDDTDTLWKAFAVAS